MLTGSDVRMGEREMSTWKRRFGRVMYKAGG